MNDIGSTNISYKWRLREIYKTKTFLCHSMSINSILQYFVIVDPNPYNVLISMGTKISIKWFTTTHPKMEYMEFSLCASVVGIFM